MKLGAFRVRFRLTMLRMVLRRVSEKVSRKVSQTVPRTVSSTRSSTRSRAVLRTERDRRTILRKTRKASRLTNRLIEKPSVLSQLPALSRQLSESNRRTFSGKAFKDESPRDKRVLATAQHVSKSQPRKTDGKIKDQELKDRARQDQTARHDRTAKRPNRTQAPLIKPAAANRSPSAYSVHLAHLLVHLLLIAKVNAQSIIKQSSVQQPVSSASSLNAKSLASIKNAYTG